MTCGDKFNQNCPTGGSRIDPAEVEGRPVCDHPGCGKPLLGTGECTDGHVQGQESPAISLTANDLLTIQKALGAAVPLPHITALAQRWQTTETTLLSTVFRDPAASAELRSTIVRFLRQNLEVPPFPVLEAAITDENKWVRREAAQTLGESDQPEAVPLLAARLADPAEDDMVRSIAATMLNRPHCRPAMPILTEALHSDLAPGIRVQALQSLAAIGRRDEVEPLLETAVEDAYPVVRRAAVAKLQALGGATVVPPLARVLRDDEAVWVRHAAATALGAVGDATAVAPLAAALETQSSEVQQAVVRALGLCGLNGYWDAIAPLSRVALSPARSSEMRHSAVEALGLVHDQEGIPPLQQLAEADATVGLRTAATLTIGRIGGPAALTALERLLDNPHWLVRATAVEAVGNVGGEGTTPLLAKAARDSVPRVRAAVVAALRGLGSAARPDLTSLSTDADDGVRQDAQAALRRLEERERAAAAVA